MNSTKSEIFSKDDILRDVRKNGYSLIKNFWTEDMCSVGRNEIESIIEDYPNVISKHSSDSRIFGIEHLSEFISKNFYKNIFINDILKDLYVTNKEIKGTLLAQKVEGIPGNKGSAGHWHRDSLPKQFKAFLYLSDVDSESGPFQFFKGSNSNLNKIVSCIRRGRNWNSLNYDTDGDLRKSNVNYDNKISVICKKGTLLIADTTLIHRGKPGLLKDRFSLTYYAFKKSVPPHIQQLTDKSAEASI